MSNPTFSTTNTDNQDVWSRYHDNAWGSRPSSDMLMEVNTGKVYNTIPGAVTVYNGQTNRFTLGVIQEKTIARFNPPDGSFSNPLFGGYSVDTESNFTGGINVPMHFLDNRRVTTGPFYYAPYNVFGGKYFYGAPSGSALSISLFPSSPYMLVSVRLAARSVDNLSQTAFDVTVTATTTSEADFYINTVATGYLGYGPRVTTGSSVFDSYQYVQMPAANLVVTSFPDWLIQKSAQNILAGGNGTVPLRAQMQAVISTVSSSWNPHPSGVTPTTISIWYTTTTVMSRHIPMTFCSTVSRPLSYGA